MPAFLLSLAIIYLEDYARLDFAEFLSLVIIVIILDGCRQVKHTEEVSLEWKLDS